VASRREGLRKTFKRSNGRPLDFAAWQALDALCDFLSAHLDQAIT
jgi:hypothetical protein